MLAEDQDLRLTPQRKAVLTVLEQSHDHPTAAEVCERVQALLPGVGAATVYRTLGLLVEHGQALELSLTAGASRYDANIHRHDHLVCDRCGRAIDVDMPIPAKLAKALEESTGFTITGYELSFRGQCPTCSTSANQ